MSKIENSAVVPAANSISRSDPSASSDMIVAAPAPALTTLIALATPSRNRSRRR